MGCEMGKIRVIMNKLVYLGRPMLDLGKIIMHEFHYDYMKPKYDDNTQLCYMDTDSLVYNITMDNFYKTSLATLRVGSTWVATAAAVLFPWELTRRSLDK